MAILNAVSADFLIYGGTDITLGDPSFVDSTWRFLAGEPDCADVENTSPQYQSDDVSGSQGVRCTNCDDVTAPGDIREFEVHTKFEHFTIYMNRNDDIFDTNDKDIGHCTAKTDDFYTCDAGLLVYQGSSMWSCTSYLTADKINAV